MITNDGKLAQIFNEYFVNIVPSLGITSFHENNDNINNDNIDNIIIKFEGHQSIVAKEQMKKYNKTFRKNTIKLSLSGMSLQTKSLQLSRNLTLKRLQNLMTYLHNLMTCLQI